MASFSVAGDYDSTLEGWRLGNGFIHGMLRRGNAHTAEGVFVIDRSANVPEFRQLRDPITFRVEKGYVTAVEGGHEATLMRRFLEGRDDGGEAYHVTELGLGKLRAHYVAKPDDAAALLGVGDAKSDEKLPRPELAAWTMVCSQLLNLDEILNK